jgi:hypothetical protein
MDLKTVGIKDLKNNLSAYLREVGRGTRILVADRHRVVAELREPRAGWALPGDTDPIVSEWTGSGVLKPPTRKKTALPASPVALPEGTAARLVDEDRAEHGG